MKVSVSSWGYRKAFAEGMTWPQYADELVRLGADGTEIHFGYIDQARRGEAYLEIIAMLRERGLDCSTIIAGNNFAMAKALDRAAQVEDFKDYLAIARASRVNRLNVFTGYHRDGQDPATERMRVIDAYHEVMPLAEGLGVLCCMENHSSVVSDVPGLLEMFAEIGSPNLVPNPDPTNVVRGFFQEPSEADVKKVLDDLRQYVIGAGNIHIKIDTFTDGVPDKVPFDEIIAILKENDYDGWIVLEYCGQDDPGPAHDAGVAYLKKAWGE